MDKFLSEIAERFATETLERVIEHLEAFIDSLPRETNEEAHYYDGAVDALITIKELLG
jgi:hypothetical protein